MLLLLFTEGPGPPPPDDDSPAGPTGSPSQSPVMSTTQSPTEVISSLAPTSILTTLMER